MRRGILEIGIAFALAFVAAPVVRAQDLPPGRVALTPAQVDRAAASRMGRVKHCYKEALDKSPTLFGVLAVGFKVSAEGKVLDRWVAMSTLGDPRLESCALKAFDGLEFPAPGGDGAEARFGMLLSVDVKKKTNKYTELPDRAKMQEDAWKAAISQPMRPAAASTPVPGPVIP